MRKIFIYILLTFAVVLNASESESAIEHHVAAKSDKSAPVVPVNTSNISWAKNYQDAVKKATELKRPILFVSSRHTCKWCVYLETTTFKDKEVIKELNKEYVSVVSYSDDNDYMPRELYRPGTPAIWFLLPSGEPMYQPLMGAIDAPKFLEALNIVKEEFNKGKDAK